MRGRGHGPPSSRRERPLSVSLVSSEWSELAGDRLGKREREREREMYTQTNTPHTTH